MQNCENTAVANYQQTWVPLQLFCPSYLMLTPNMFQVGVYEGFQPWMTEVQKDYNKMVDELLINKVVLNNSNPLLSYSDQNFAHNFNTWNNAFKENEAAEVIDCDEDCSNEGSKIKTKPHNRPSVTDHSYRIDVRNKTTFRALYKNFCSYILKELKGKKEPNKVIKAIMCTLQDQFPEFWEDKVTMFSLVGPLLLPKFKTSFNKWIDQCQEFSDSDKELLKLVTEKFKDIYQLKIASQRENWYIHPLFKAAKMHILNNSIDQNKFWRRILSNRKKTLTCESTFIDQISKDIHTLIQ